MFFANSPNYFSLNLETLQKYQPGFQAHLPRIPNQVLFSAEAVPRVTVLGKQIAMQETFHPSGTNTWGYIVYGLGRGELIQALLNDKKPGVPVLIVDSLEDMVSLSFQYFDLQAIFKHPDVTYLGTDLSVLPAQLHAYLSKRKDLLAVDWLVNPWVSQIAMERQDLFFLQVFQQYQAYLAQAPDFGSDALFQLYASLAQPMQTAYGQLPLSCKSGCADCCKKGNGFDLSIQPLEWASIFRYITEIMPETQRNQLLRSVVLYLAQNSEVLTKALHYFDRALETMQTDSGNQAFFQLTAPLRKDPCPLLGDDDTCGIYTHRPLICRIFGNSYFGNHQPYTCEKDQGLMEKILLDEGKKRYLLEGQGPLATLKTLHAYYPYTQFLYGWLFTHLDGETKNWVSTPRLDYHQFQVLVEHPEHLEKQIQTLKNWAAALA